MRRSLCVLLLILSLMSWGQAQSTTQPTSAVTLPDAPQAHDDPCDCAACAKAYGRNGFVSPRRWPARLLSPVAHHPGRVVAIVGGGILVALLTHAALSQPAQLHATFTTLPLVVKRQ